MISNTSLSTVTKAATVGDSQNLNPVDPGNFMLGQHVDWNKSN